MALTRELRQKGRATRTGETLSMDRPDVFLEWSPEGPYPVIAYRTRPCSRSVMGLCTPCGYSSKLVQPNFDADTLEKSIDRQTDWILKEFHRLFPSSTSADGFADWARPNGRRQLYIVELSGPGSFFHDSEIPPELRRRILQRFAKFREQQRIDLCVMLECRPEDLLAAGDSGELENLRDLFESLNVVVNMGLEDADEFLRNTVYAKDLTLFNFERATQMAKQYGLDPGAFIFAGAFILTPAEALNAVKSTLKYCQMRGLFANVMLPNIQPYTVPALLFEFERYTLPEPFFLLDIADLLLTYRPKRETKEIFHWFVGGLVARPRPLATILSNSKKCTTNGTTRSIYEAVHQLMETLDHDQFRTTAKSLRSGAEYDYYLETLHMDDSLPWPTRLHNAIDFAKGAIEEYDAMQKCTQSNELRGVATHEELRAYFQHECASMV